MLEVALNPGPGDEARRAYLRPLRGDDEAAIVDCSELEAMRLLDALLVEAPGARIGPGAAWKLAITDRDRLLAALYRRYYGERIQGSIACRNCGMSYDLAFDLSRLTGGMEPERPKLSKGPDADGVYAMPDGRRFRRPTGEDQQSILDLDPAQAAAALLERCVVEGDATEAPERLEAAMAEVAPIMSAELEATCPECESTRSVNFDIRAHLLGALESERPWLMREVHAIASRYGWSRREILELSRDERRAFVKLIEADRAGGRKRSP